MKHSRIKPRRVISIIVVVLTVLFVAGGVCYAVSDLFPTEEYTQRTAKLYGYDLDGNALIIDDTEEIWTVYCHVEAEENLIIEIGPNNVIGHIYAEIRY